ncbi:hypothetical protein Asal01_01356 [Fodinibius salicampi]
METSIAPSVYNNLLMEASLSPSRSVSIQAFWTFQLRSASLVPFLLFSLAFF